VEVDHVLMAVADLDQGAARLEREHGLQVVGGGRHPGLGTANRILPLGRQYLELIAIADPAEAANSHLGRRVQRALAEGRAFVDWALRTEDLEALQERLQGAGWELPPAWSGSRPRPDGSELRWRTQDLDPGLEATVIPFVIEWDIPAGAHPGEQGAEHTLKKVVLGARNPAAALAKLRLLLGESDLYEVVEADADGVREVILDGSLRIS
jgi:glyoxalase-like protein